MKSFYEILKESSFNFKPDTKFLYSLLRAYLLKNKEEYQKLSSKYKTKFYTSDDNKDTSFYRPRNNYIYINLSTWLANSLLKFLKSDYTSYLETIHNKILPIYYHEFTHREQQKTRPSDYYNKDSFYYTKGEDWESNPERVKDHDEALLEIEANAHKIAVGLEKIYKRIHHKKTRGSFFRKVVLENPEKIYPYSYLNNIADYYNSKKEIWNTFVKKLWEFFIKPEKDVLQNRADRELIKEVRYFIKNSNYTYKDIKLILRTSITDLKQKSWDKSIKLRQDSIEAYRYRVNSLKNKLKNEKETTIRDDLIKEIENFTLYIKQDKEILHSIKNATKLKNKSYSFLRILKQQLLKKRKNFIYWDEEINEDFTWEKNESDAKIK
jgi:hypothetical protein